MPQPDLVPAAQAVADVALAVQDEQLDLPTPCPEYSVGGMLAHIHGLSQAFAAAAAKDLGVQTSTPPEPGAQELPADWRDTMPKHLDAVGHAWRDPQAWTGMTAAGGVDLPGEVAGLVALNELVIHGWDVARSTGQEFDPGADAVSAVHEYLVESRKGDVPEALFKAAVDVPADAALLDQAVGLSGRNPAWTP